jgi:hypothetical protein
MAEEDSYRILLATNCTKNNPPVQLLEETFVQYSTTKALLDSAHFIKDKALGKKIIFLVLEEHQGRIDDSIIESTPIVKAENEAAKAVKVKEEKVVVKKEASRTVGQKRRQISSLGAISTELVKVKQEIKDDEDEPPTTMTKHGILNVDLTETDTITKKGKQNQRMPLQQEDDREADQAEESEFKRVTRRRGRRD